MTTNTLDLIEARANAATNGPWRLWADTSDPENKRGASVESAWSHDADGCDTEMITDYCSPADAVFIAAARTDVEKMAKALRAVEAVHSQELGGTPDGSYADICGGCPSYWPCPTITAIREALGG